jgi:hypothetical protein
MNKNIEPLLIKVEKIDNGTVVLNFNDQSIVLNKKFLPKEIKEGDWLEVEFFTPEQAEKRRHNLAQAVLEEILGGE